MFRTGSSFEAIYGREVARGIEMTRARPPLTEADVAALPSALRTYLHRARAVGAPRVRNFRARFGGEMRLARDSPWMPITADQHTFADPAVRVFLVRASRFGLPFQALHLYSNERATMRVRVASLFDVVDARGPQLDQSETVTFFNDLCLFAPSMLADADVRWTELDRRTIRGTFEIGGNSVSAELAFNEEGDLEGFVSNDRYQSADGKTYAQLPWSTPIFGYRDYGGARLPDSAEAIWKQPDGDLAYARFRLLEIQYNVGLPEDEHEIVAANDSAGRADVRPGSLYR